MFIIIFSPFIACLSQDLKNLAYKAINNSNFIKTSKIQSSINQNYDKDGISFHLPYDIKSIEQPGIKGYALNEDKKLLAIHQDNNTFEENNYFIDNNTQKLYRAKRHIGNYKDVDLYKVTETNPLDTFTNLKLKMKNVSKIKPKNFECNSFSSNVLGERCRVIESINWDIDRNRPNLIKISDDIPFKMYAGVLANAVGSMQAKAYGLGNVKIDYQFDIESIFGIGFSFDEDIDIIDQTFNLIEESIPIYTFTKIILGMKFNFSFDVSFLLTFKNVTIKIPKGIGFYRNITTKLRQSGTFSSNLGVNHDPFDFDFHSNNEDLETNDTFDYKPNFQMDYTPDIKVSATITIQLGKVTIAKLEIGGKYLMDIGFTSDSNKCTSPYLYGKANYNLIGYIYGESLSFKGFSLIEPISEEISLISNFETPNYCLFSPDQTMEGQNSLIDFNSKGSYIISTEKATAFSLVNYDTYYPKLFAYDNKGNVIDSMSLPKIRFEKNEYKISKKMILIDPPKNSYLKYQIYIVGVIWNSYKNSSNFYLNQKTANECLADLLSFCMETTIKKAYHVEIFKEFQGKEESSFISFKPYVINKHNSTLGMITHGIYNDPYSVLPMKNVFDDSSTHQNSGNYLNRNELQIMLSSVYHKIDNLKNATIKLYNCILDDSCELMCKMFLKPKQNKLYYSDELGIYDRCIFNMENEMSKLKINFSVVTKDGKQSNSLILKHKELDRSHDFYLDFKNQNFNLTFNVTINTPDVVFELPQPLKSNQRGIISRIFESKRTIKFDVFDSERYIILRFTNQNDFNSNTKVGCLLQVNSLLLPLCPHSFLDKNHISLVLNPKESIHNSTIEIPFRLFEEKTNKYAVTLLSTFVTTEDAKCKNGITISEPAEVVGCFEATSHKSNYINDYSLITNPYINPTIIKPKNGNWKLRTYQTESDFFKIFPSFFGFPEKSLTFHISESIAQEFIGKHMISIRCDRCKKLIINYENGKSNEISGNEGIFNINPEYSEDILLYAICNSSFNSFCEFTESFDKNGLCLLKYGTSAGINEIDNDDELNKLSCGVNRQLVYNKTISKYSKDWDGYIEIIEKDIKPNELKLKIYQYRNKSIEISLNIGKLNIPFSQNKYSIDPRKFFQILGINEPKNGYTKDIAHFTEDGKVITKTSAFNEKKLKLQSLEDVSDVPEDYILARSYVIEKQKTLSTTGIVFIVLGCVAVFAFVGFFIYLKKFKTIGFRRVISDPLVEYEIPR